MPHIVRRSSRHILITGGAGFIGSNLIAHLLAQTDAAITLYDNLFAPGARANLRWLQSQATPGRLRCIQGDVRDPERLCGCVPNADEIYHLAFACTANPVADADVNAGGTLHILDAARASWRNPLVLYLSTSAIYKRLCELPVRPGVTRFIPLNPTFTGVSESFPVDYEAPDARGCGQADRALQDYARLYGARTVVLRVDTVAGPRQFATNQHGWIARLIDDMLGGHPVALHASGLRVHDVLHIDDLIDAVMAARAYLGVTEGRVYNVGGAARSISEIEMVHLIERICHVPADLCHAPASRSAIPLYYSDCRAFAAATDWRPRYTVEQAVREAAAFWRASLSVAHPLSITQTFHPHRQAA